MRIGHWGSAILLFSTLAWAEIPPSLRETVGYVRNGDFAQISPDGKGFVSWEFHISRNARVSVTVDRTGGRGGTPAPLFHDESPLSPHVYGRFRQTVKVLPQMGYRLSCWCKAQEAAAGNHWTDWKTYSLALPGGTYDWTRVETYFETKADQTELELGLNIVDVTEKLWIDDLSLEPELSVAERREIWLGLWSRPTVNADQEALPYRLWLAGAPSQAVIRIEALAAGERVGFAEVTPHPPGLASGSLKINATQTRQGRLRASLIGPTGKALVVAERPIEIFSQTYVEARRKTVAEAAEKLAQAVAQWERRGLPTDYPRVTATVAENFLPWIDEDIARGRLELAAQELEELHEAITKALRQCAQPPPVAALTVPRYTGGPIRIVGGHFVAPVRWPDGRTEERPVFFMGYGHFGSVRRDVEKFPAYGLNLIQVEFGPNSVVQPDFSCKPDVIDDFLKLLARCQKAGVAVNLLLSPHYFPQWAFERWPEIGGVNGGFIRYDIDAPQTRQVIEAFLRAVIPRLRGQPALHSLCLSNEPIYISAPQSAHNRRLWHEWLKRRHGEIGRLNALYGTQYASFEEVPLVNPDDLSTNPRRVEIYDWATFNNERFAGWHRWMADIIHELAPEIPVHAKIMNTIFSPGCIGWGVDPEQFCGLSQIAGNDCCNWYERRPEARFASGALGEMQFYDCLRSMRGQPVFNSENHIVPDRDWGPVPGRHMRQLIWEGALHGLGASTTWVWERCPYDQPQSDFAGSIMHRPILCDAHGRTALDLMRLAPEVVALQEQPARVALVYSIASLVWNGGQYSHLLSLTYSALTALGEKIDFVTAQQLAEGAGRRYRAIVLPGVTHFEEAGFRGLQAFAAQPGRRLIAIGEGCLAADEYNRPRDLAGLPLRSLKHAGSAEALQQPLQEALGFTWPVRVEHIGPVKEPRPFVAFRWARQGQRWLVNLCNYSHTPARIRVFIPGTKRLVNLLTQQPISGAITLDELEPILLEAR